MDRSANQMTFWANPPLKQLRGQIALSFPMLSGTDLQMVALCMNDKGMPEITNQRLGIARILINGLVRSNVHMGNIYVDPLV